MAAKDFIIQYKMKLQDILMSNIPFVSECAFQKKLLVDHEYLDLKDLPASKATSALVDKVIFKGEMTCNAFLHLLQDTQLTNVCPDLKTMPWYKPPATSATDPTTDSSEEHVKRRKCCEHEEQLLFCEEEQRVVCHICDSPHNHKLVPIEEAVKNLKDQLKSNLETLKDKRVKRKNVKTKYTEMLQHNKQQLRTRENEIKAQFQILRQFLIEEEQVRLAALREEEGQKGKAVRREMKIIEEQISSLSESVSAVEQELRKPNVSFLSSYKHTQTIARDKCTLSDPQLVSGALIDVAKHMANLPFRVWEKMKEKVKFTPVVLDPNTAHPCLCLSEDLTSVWRTNNWEIPDNPERFNYDVDLLGSEGFSSGKHSYDVEVGDYPDWIIGLAKESVRRKGEKCVAPKYGFWILKQKEGDYDNGQGPVKVHGYPERIRVQLDYERGEVSFYNPEDMTHICTHYDTFTEKLYPYFMINRKSESDSDSVSIGIKVFQAEVGKY